MNLTGCLSLAKLAWEKRIVEAMTLFDIFYQHTEWWCNPDLGHDTQGKYGDVLKEMEDCALDYARSIKDTGDRWKRVIENETRELCRPNHYSWNLRGDKKEWHDTTNKKSH